MYVQPDPKPRCILMAPPMLDIPLSAIVTPFKQGLEKNRDPYALGHDEIIWMETSQQIVVTPPENRKGRRFGVAVSDLV